MMRRGISLWVLANALLLAAVACGGDDVMSGDASIDSGRGDTSVDAVSPDAPDSSAGPNCESLVRTPPTRVCGALASDYSPGADDMWPACISDDGTYHRIQESISSVARVMAFDEIGSTLFDPAREALADDFLQARLVYQTDEGLDSRVVRRYDPHFSVPEGTDCTVDGVPAMFPDYCVGPAQIQPMIRGALQAGAMGEGDPRMNAAKVEAGLLWFFYVSQYKESYTCTTKAKDCDSAYAYYTGGAEARGGIGLAGRVAATDPAAHDRAWDGLLAVRCWRDLDDGETAMDLERRELARDQYDRAVLDGVAALVRESLVQTCDAEPPTRNYHFARASALARALLRQAGESSVGSAGLQTLVSAETADGLDVGATVAALDEIFDCP